MCLKTSHTRPDRKMFSKLTKGKEGNWLWPEETGLYMRGNIIQYHGNYQVECRILQFPCPRDQILYKPASFAQTPFNHHSLLLLFAFLFLHYPLVSELLYLEIFIPFCTQKISSTFLYFHPFFVLVLFSATVLLPCLGYFRAGLEMQKLRNHG